MVCVCTYMCIICMCIKKLIFDFYRFELDIELQHKNRHQSEVRPLYFINELPLLYHTKSTVLISTMCIDFCTLILQSAKFLRAVNFQKYLKIHKNKIFEN